MLAQFGPTRRRARQAYRAFVAGGRRLGRRPDLQGGGLVRSLGGWDAVRELRRGREAYLGDERILGSADFVEAVRREVAQAAPAPRRAAIAYLWVTVLGHAGRPLAARLGIRPQNVYRAAAQGAAAAATWKRILSTC